MAGVQRPGRLSLERSRSDDLGSERPLAGNQNAVAETPQDPGLKVDHHGVVLPGCDPDARQWPQWIVRDGTTLLGWSQVPAP
jgi:hypothetical protein